jgi:hypothetical protein
MLYELQNHQRYFQYLYAFPVDLDKSFVQHTNLKKNNAYLKSLHCQVYFRSALEVSSQEIKQQID